MPCPRVPGDEGFRVIATHRACHVTAGAGSAGSPGRRASEHGAHAPRPSACVGGTSAARPSGMRPEGRPWGGGEDGVRSQPGPPVSPDDLPAGSRSPPSLPAGGHRPPRPAKGKRTLRVPAMQTAPLRDLCGRPVPTGSPGGGGRVGVRGTRGRLGLCQALARSVRGCALWSAPAQVRGAGGPRLLAVRADAPGSGSRQSPTLPWCPPAGHMRPAGSPARGRPRLPTPRVTPPPPSPARLPRFPTLSVCSFSASRAPSRDGG